MRPGDDDPFTLEIVAGSLQAVADEMFAVLRRTAMSAIIYEVLDAGTAVTDAEGGLASSGAGIPSFVGVLDKAVRRVLELHLEPRPGDVFATNDPFYGGVTHLNDVVLAMPVFVEERLVAWAATIAHWNDVGGMAPGSISTKATDLFQEGLRLPAVKVVDGGEEIVSVTRILSANSCAISLNEVWPLLRNHTKVAPRYWGCSVLTCSVTRNSGSPAASIRQENSSKARSPDGTRRAGPTNHSAIATRVSWVGRSAGGRSITSMVGTSWGSRLTEGGRGSAMEA